MAAPKIYEQFVPPAGLKKKQKTSLFLLTWHCMKLQLCISPICHKQSLCGPSNRLEQKIYGRGAHFASKSQRRRRTQVTVINLLTVLLLTSITHKLTHSHTQTQAWLFTCINKLAVICQPYNATGKFWHHEGIHQKMKMFLSPMQPLALLKLFPQSHIRFWGTLELFLWRCRIKDTRWFNTACSAVVSRFMHTGVHFSSRALRTETIHKPHNALNQTVFT